MKTALVLACDDNFVAYASVVARRAAMLSSESFPIVVISDGVTDENKKLAQKFCSRISFIEASHLLDGKPFRYDDHFTRATYLRLFMDEILADLDRIVYIDCDMTPLADLSPLLAMVPKAAPVIATYDLVQLRSYEVYGRLPLSRNAGYMQSGLVVFDIKAIREEGVFADTLKYALAFPEKLLLADQDAFNVALQGRWQVMDWRWNVLNLEAQNLPAPFYVRHHGGFEKPWTANKTRIERAIIRQWRDDLAESPWPQKFTPDRHGPLTSCVRSISRAAEEKIKLYRRQDKYMVTKRYLDRLPTLTFHIEQAARAGRLASAL